ncbi:choice-of-anchor M domain-containing protein [Schaalia sp. lx-100]|uniref:choice-of-anchor M domain-containing protein n=1 Tax=Schaalia sp. lx-100 TaxID=2899081 RepID=UPI001E3F1587|nr:choice-of-anchor M domain-containing protein [Schaalia sp. lx-100]MCD4557017.1 choice-of-anchor M domain-containing protein [Schaalia sp. lx-100]
MKTTNECHLQGGSVFFHGAETQQSFIWRIAFFLSAFFLGLTPMLLAPTAWAEDDLAQSVDSTESVSAHNAVVESGHVDIGPKIVEGEWKILARDDSGATPLWRDLNHFVLKVNDRGLLDAPTQAPYEFLGGKEGQKWWIIPQTQNPDVVWLGWNTQDPEATQRMSRGATMSIGHIHGPGQAWLFLQDGTFGEPRVLVDATVTSPQDVWIDVNTHVHANWVFTQPGVYIAPIRICADMQDGAHMCAQSALRFAVGDSTDPEEALKAPVPEDFTQAENMSTPQSSSADTPSSASVTPGKAGTKTGTASGASETRISTMTYILIASAVLILILVIVLIVLRSRATRRDIMRVQEERRLHMQNHEV